MSVKDRIAMWNNMSNSGSNSQPPALKLTSDKPKPVYSPPQQAVQKPIVNAGPEVDTTSILTPSMLKKKMQEQLGGQQKLPAFISNNNSTPVKGITKPVNPNPTPAVSKPIVQLQPIAKAQQQQASINPPQKQSIETFSERKKRLQEQIQKNQFHLVAPVQIRKVESITIQSEGPKQQAVIETDVPLVGVKQRAQQLSQFYQQKKQQEPQRSNSLNIAPAHQEHPTHIQEPAPQNIEHQIISHSKQPQSHPSNENAPNVESTSHQPEINQVPRQQPKPAQQWDYTSEESSLAMVQQSENMSEQPQVDAANELRVRLKNKLNQQKRRLFQSDED